MEKKTLELAKYFQEQAEKKIHKKHKNISVNAGSLLIICAELIKKNLEQDSLINDFYERNEQWHQLISKSEINDSMLAVLIIHLENKNKALESEIKEIGEMTSLGYYTRDNNGAYLPKSFSENKLSKEFTELFSIHK